MACPLGYHNSVRHSISASVVFLSLLTVPTILVSRGHAQINGAPASVTSPGFGGRAVNGPPASVTSLGPRGYAPGPPVSFSTSFPNSFPNRSHRGDGRNRRHRHYGYGDYGSPLMYAVPVPYAVDNSAADEDDADVNDSDPNYQGGPTVFDRRGLGARSYISPVQDATPPAVANHSDDPPADSDPAPDPTLLVFKDGRKLEVGNYAIVGATLFDLTPGHPRKIALADLDLPATLKQNDDRGVVFQLPPSIRAN